MFKDTEAFSGFSVSNVIAAQSFYKDQLGLDVEQTTMGLSIKINGATPIFVYEKPDHVPASFTILNFKVQDIEKAVADLSAKGIPVIPYPGMTDEKGIARGKVAGQGPDIAWFADPAGNILSVLCE